MSLGAIAVGKVDCGGDWIRLACGDVGRFRLSFVSASKQMDVQEFLQR